MLPSFMISAEASRPLFLFFLHLSQPHYEPNGNRHTHDAQPCSCHANCNFDHLAIKDVLASCTCIFVNVVVTKLRSLAIFLPIVILFIAQCFIQSYQHGSSYQSRSTCVASNLLRLFASNLCNLTCFSAWSKKSPRYQRHIMYFRILSFVKLFIPRSAGLSLPALALMCSPLIRSISRCLVFTKTFPCNQLS